MATTYGKLAQLIRDTYYKGKANDESDYSLRFIAEKIAGEVAVAARDSAFANSNMGESAIANDQFSTTYVNLPLLTDTVTSEKYVTLPASAAGLPGGRELAQVIFVSCPKLDVVPVSFNQMFSQRLIGDPVVVDLCYLKSGRIYFEYLNPVASGNVNVTLVGSVPVGDRILDLELNIPKDVEVIITDRVLAKLNPMMPVKADKVNDGNSQQ